MSIEPYLNAKKIVADAIAAGLIRVVPSFRNYNQMHRQIYKDKQAEKKRVAYAEKMAIARGLASPFIYKPSHRGHRKYVIYSKDLAGCHA